MELTRLVQVCAHVGWWGTCEGIVAVQEWRATLKKKRRKKWGQKINTQENKIREEKRIAQN